MRHQVPAGSQVSVRRGRTVAPDRRTAARTAIRPGPPRAESGTGIATVAVQARSSDAGVSGSTVEGGAEIPQHLPARLTGAAAAGR